MENEQAVKLKCTFSTLSRLIVNLQCYINPGVCAPVWDHTDHVMYI